MKPLNELKKGCGCHRYGGKNDTLSDICGKKNWLCSDCQALIKDREDVLKMVKDLRYIWNKGNCNEREKECLNYACNMIEQQLKGDKGE